MTVGAITAQLRLDMTNFREGLVKANSLLEQYSGAAMRASAMLAGFGAADAGGDFEDLVFELVFARRR